MTQDGTVVARGVIEEFLVHKIPVRLFLDAKEESLGIPAQVKARFNSLIPIDLLPEYPLNSASDADALEVDLAFDRSVHRCRIPWSTVVALIGNEMMLEFRKPTDFTAPPKRALLQVIPTEPPPAGEVIPESKKSAPALTVIKGGRT